MAFTNVEGTVSRINANGEGFGLKETWPKRDGGESARYWGVFMPDGERVTVAVGDRVKVSGTLGTKVSKNDSRFVDHTVGRAKVEVVSSASAPPAEGSTGGAGDGFPADVPF